MTARPLDTGGPVPSPASPAPTTPPRPSLLDDVRAFLRPVSPGTSVHPLWPRALAGLILLFDLAVLLFLPTVDAMVSTWEDTTTYNHGFLVLPIAVILAWMRRDELAPMPPTQTRHALLFTALAGLVWLVGEIATVRQVTYVGFVGILMSLVLFQFGWAILWRLWFPVLFLIFMVPAGDELVPWLQDLTATASVALLEWTGASVLRNGILIEVAFQGTYSSFIVAEACAGVRFLIANVVVAALFAYLAYRRWWKAALFMLLAFAIPVGANVLRAYGIMMLAVTTDNEVAVGADHLVYGWGFFTVVMLLILFIGNRFADRFAGQAFARPPSPRSLARPGRAPLWGAGLAAASLGLVLLAGWVTTHPPDDVGPRALPAPPLAPGAGWAGPTVPSRRLATWRPAEDFRHDGLERWAYRGPNGAEADLVVAWLQYQRQGVEAVHSSNRAWEQEEAERLSVRRRAVAGAPAWVPPAEINRVRRDRSGEETIVYQWYWVDGTLTSDPYRAKLAQVAGALTGGPRHAAVLLLAVPFDPTSDPAMAAADATAAALLAAMPDLPRWLADDKPKLAGAE